MSGFWTLSSGEQAQVDTQADGVETGKLVRIADGTKLMAVPRTIEVLNVQEGKEGDALDGMQLGWKLGWEIIEDGEALGLGINQGIKTFATKSKQRDEAIKVVCFLDNMHNNGALQAAGVEPGMDEFLAAIEGQPTLILVRSQTRKDPETGEERHFQWVGGVFRARGAAHKTQVEALAAADEKIKGQLAAQAAAKQKREEAQKKAREAAAEAARLEAEANAADPQDNEESVIVSDEDIPY